MSHFLIVDEEDGERMPESEEGGGGIGGRVGVGEVR